MVYSKKKAFGWREKPSQWSPSTTQKGWASWSCWLQLRRASLVSLLANKAQTSAEVHRQRRHRLCHFPFSSFPHLRDAFTAPRRRSCSQSAGHSLASSEYWIQTQTLKDAVKFTVITWPADVILTFAYFLLQSIMKEMTQHCGTLGALIERTQRNIRNEWMFLWGLVL